MRKKQWFYIEEKIGGVARNPLGADTGGIMLLKLFFSAEYWFIYILWSYYLTIKIL